MRMMGKGKQANASHFIHKKSENNLSSLIKKLSLPAYSLPFPLFELYIMLSCKEKSKRNKLHKFSSRIARLFHSLICFHLFLLCRVKASRRI